MRSWEGSGHAGTAPSSVSLRLPAAFLWGVTADFTYVTAGTIFTYVTKDISINPLISQITKQIPKGPVIVSWGHS